VSAPFHSRYMREPMEQFAGFLSTFEFRVPRIPVIANASAEPYAADAVRQTLARQIGHSVRWLDTVLWLLDRGVSDFQECGPGTVLTKIVAQIRSKETGFRTPLTRNPVS